MPLKHTHPTLSRFFLTYINCFLLIVSFAPVTSSSQGYTDENISLAQGLSQSTVFTLSQDSKGFIWAGTQDGLNKYDGLEFKTYYNIPFDSSSLSSAHVTSMLHDSKGRFWIGTANHGLNLYIPEKDKFKSFVSKTGSKNTLLSNTIHIIYEGPGGTIWLGSGNGLQRIITGSDANGNNTVEFETVFRDTSRTAFFAISTIYENTNGEVWIGTYRGLLKLSFQNNDAFLPEGGIIYTTNDGLNSDLVMAFQRDPEGNYWIGTGKGLCVLNGKSNKIKQIPFPKSSHLITMGEVNNFCISSDGTLWIASGRGLYTLSAEEVKNVFDKTPELHLFRYKTKQINSGALCIREDKISKGIMWVGTGASGIIKLNSDKGKNIYTNHLRDVLQSAFVFSIAKDKEGIVWIGTTDGLVRFDKSKNDYRLFQSSPHRDKGLRSDYITNIKIDKNDQLWIGTQKGLYRVKKRNSDKPGFEITTLFSKSQELIIRDLAFDKNGDLIVVLPGRVFHLAINTVISTPIVQAITEGNKLPPGFSYMSALVDASNKLWLGTTKGLYIYNASSNGQGFDISESLFYEHRESDTNSLRCHTINEIFQDSEGRTWLCTPNGFIKAELNGNRMSFRNYSTVDGLKNNAVYGVLENPQDGALWMSTNGGLSKFDPATSKFSNFDIHDGLQSNEFNGGAFFRAPDNEFFFGGVDGYSSFYPSEILEDTVAPRVYITGFSLTGEQNTPMQIGESKRIELKYNQNSFNINFIALQYSNPSQNKYAYRLEGFQKEWTKNDHGNQINFSQLPPGEYSFQVIGCNSDGVVSAKADTLSIIIHPPFWNTIWFYVLIALFISLVAWLLHAYLLRIKLRQLEEIEIIRKETAADFHDELGHKLTTISWFGEILKKKIGPDQKELRPHLDRIIDTAGGLYHTMRDMVWAMDPGQDSMKDLYRQIQEFGESLFDQTGVEFKATQLNGEFTGLSIPLTQKRHVLLIFKEAMHNSFKHAQSKQVKLDLFRENNHITIKLEDNGRGFNLNWTETGNGLKNVKKRADAIGGKLNIVSTNSGTMLELEVPLKS